MRGWTAPHAGEPLRSTVPRPCTISYVACGAAEQQPDTSPRRLCFARAHTYGLELRALGSCTPEVA